MQLTVRNKYTADGSVCTEGQINPGPVFGIDRTAERMEESYIYYSEYV